MRWQKRGKVSEIEGNNSKQEKRQIKIINKAGECMHMYTTFKREV